MNNIESLRDEGCIFCTKPAQDDDRKSLILYRGDSAFIIMNLYPYNTGHVMIAPYRHVGELELLDGAEMKELMELTSLAVKASKAEMKPQGFNVGMNLGQAAGAGFAGHVHVHVVPRWQGDTNFMPVVGESKVMPESLEDTYDRLLKSLQALINTG